MRADVRIDWPYLVEDRDRHGNLRRYFRRKGQPKIRIHGEPGTEAFALAYWAARNGETLAKPKPRAARPGTFHYLVQVYYASPEFRKLDREHTQIERRRQLDPLVEKIGDMPAAIDPRAIRDGVKAREEAAARKWLAALRHVYAVAIDQDLIVADPTAGIRAPKRKTDGFHTWTLEECLAYEAAHPVGTIARTAYAIGVYLAARRSDAVQIGRPHERGGEITYTQHKNRNRSPVRITQPIVPPLRTALDGWQGDGLTYLQTAYGKPFSIKGFGDKFKSWCIDAGLPHCSFHGLRKATAARMAEAGCSSRQIMAVLGDKTLQQAEVYTRAADNARMAKDALGDLFGRQSVPQELSGTKTPKKLRQNNAKF